MNRSLKEFGNASTSLETGTSPSRRTAGRPQAASRFLVTNNGDADYHRRQLLRRGQPAPGDHRIESKSRAGHDPVRSAPRPAHHCAPSELPTLADSVIADGTSQSGWDVFSRPVVIE